MSGGDAVDHALTLLGQRPDALLAVVGPTASGKTALAVHVAERVGGEVISCDSVQVYRGFDIGSGKPTDDELARARHHLVSELDPREPIDASRFASLARARIEAVRSRGKVPILCGGTFLWTKALLYGLVEAPPADPALRAQHAEIAAREGRAALHERLRAVDPEAALRLHPNDFVRVSRALEVHALSGRPLSAWHAEHAFAKAHLPAQLVALRQDPEALAMRIRARARAWLAGGWLAEVRGLLDAGLADARAMGSVGYREVAQHLRGELPEAELEDAVVRATRVFARRQRTWLNHVDVAWLPA